MLTSTSRNRKKKLSKNIIGITLGDPAGIGPEVVFKALSKPSIRSLAKFMIIGDYANFQKYCPRTLNHCTLLDTGFCPERTIRSGGPSLHSARAAFSYLDKAVELLKKNEISSLVTAPVCKESMTALGENFVGHTEMLAQAFSVKKFEMMFVTPTLKTIVVTRHIPLKDVSRALSRKKIHDAIVLANQSLLRSFRIKNPQIAVCGLNPHAGESGTIGMEEQKIIIPAIRLAQKRGIRVKGPFAADTLFSPDIQNKFDLIVAMYHDQGLIPIKTLSFTKVVNLTIGLPFIRTSPAHGTAFDIAGKNMASALSMIEAIRLAADLMI